MQRTDKFIQCSWRGLIGCIVAYALVINALLTGIVGAEWTASAAAGLLTENCLTDSRDAPAPSDRMPAGHSEGMLHCVLCTPAASPAVLPADLSSAAVLQPCAGVPASMDERTRCYLPGDLGKLPRGPPQQA
jgi:hypothetical protein